MSPAGIALTLRLLDLLILGIAVAPVALAKIRQLLRENRDPTPEEWAILDCALDEYRMQLHTDGDLPEPDPTDVRR